MAGHFAVGIVVLALVFVGLSWDVYTSRKDKQRSRRSPGEK